MTRIDYDFTGSDARAPRTYDELVSWLEDRDWPVIPNGANGVRTFCPVCEGDDSNSPSLTIGRGSDGRALLFCFSGKGCGLNRTGRDRDPRAVSRAFKTFGTAEVPSSAARKWRRRNRPGKSPLELGAVEVARYKYPNGEVKVRYAWDGWMKDFRWPYGKSEPMLYRPPTRKEIERYIVVLVEGEKDVDRLRELGFVATTSSEGHLTPNLAREHLSGATVAVLRDYDRHGDQARDAALRTLDGVAVAAFRVELPGLKWVESGGPDVSDWLDAGGTSRELERLIDAAEGGAR